MLHANANIANSRVEHDEFHKIGNECKAQVNKWANQHIWSMNKLTLKYI